MNSNPYSRIYEVNIKGYLIIACMIIGLIPSALSQTGEATDEEETGMDTTEVATEETEEKTTLRVSFDAFKINDSVQLQTRLSTKVKGKFQNIPGVKVSFYKEEIVPENLLGKGTSNHRGEAFWLFPVVQTSDSAGTNLFWAVVQDHPLYEDAEESVSISPSVMEMELEEEDSVKTVNIFLGYPDETNQIVPVAEAECQVFVKRLFGLLPVGESAITDEEGRATIEFPSDIKGDESGNITVVAKIVEHEIIGNVEVNQAIKWGIPTAKDNFYLQRELWSARANSPIALVVIVNLVLLGVWGIIAFIFIEIFRINRLGKPIK